ncbi:MAG: zinc ribbon domain-containing protein [Christensenellales bacterium]
MEENIRCNYCGNLIKRSDFSCPHCGAKNSQYGDSTVVVQKVEQSTSQENKQEETTKLEVNNKKTNKLTKTDKISIFAIIFAFILPVIGLIVAIYALVRYNKEKAENKTINTDYKGLAIWAIVISSIFLLSYVLKHIATNYLNYWYDNSLEYEYTDFFD